MLPDNDPDVPVLIDLFERVFFSDYNTRVVHAASDPEYLPADSAYDFHRIAFAHGFFSSALHEIAHWCVAGSARRQLRDFGYWYAPDGRTVEQQEAFYRVEVKPQAFEWIFTVAAGRKFRVSTDNLNGDTANDRQFELDVYEQVCTYLRDGLPERAALWAKALDQQFQQQAAYLLVESYCLP